MDETTKGLDEFKKPVPWAELTALAQIERMRTELKHFMGSMSDQMAGLHRTLHQLKRHNHNPTNGEVTIPLNLSDIGYMSVGNARVASKGEEYF